MPTSADVLRKDEKLFILIINCLKEPNFYRKLHLAYLMSFNIPPELGKRYKLDEFQTNLKNLLLDENFVRSINFRESIIGEDGNVYFGQEHLDCPFNYEPEIEKAVLQIDLNITEFLGCIVNELDLPKKFSMDEVEG